MQENNNLITLKPGQKPLFQI